MLKQDAPALEPYTLNLSVEGDRVHLSGRSACGQEWDIWMLPAPAVRLSLALAACVAHIEGVGDER